MSAQSNTTPEVTMNRNYTAKWTQTHTFFENGSGCKVHSLENLKVLASEYIEEGAEGWGFTYEAATGRVEKHLGFRTMKAAKEAAVLYATSPIGTPIPR